jgi:hypothetical protein
MVADAMGVEEALKRDSFTKRRLCPHPESDGNQGQSEAIRGHQRLSWGDTEAIRGN